MQRSMLSVSVILLSMINSYSILEEKALFRFSRAACLVFALLEERRKTSWNQHTSVKAQPLFLMVVYICLCPTEEQPTAVPRSMKCHELPPSSRTEQLRLETEFTRVHQARNKVTLLQAIRKGKSDSYLSKNLEEERSFQIQKKSKSSPAWNNCNFSKHIKKFDAYFLYYIRGSQKTMYECVSSKHTIPLVQCKINKSLQFVF